MTHDCTIEMIRHHLKDLDRAIAAGSLYGVRAAWTDALELYGSLDGPGRKSVYSSIVRHDRLVNNFVNRVVKSIPRG